MRGEYNADVTSRSRFPRFRRCIVWSPLANSVPEFVVLMACQQRDVEHLRTSIVAEVTRHLTVLGIDAMRRHRRHTAWKMRADVTNLYRKVRITRNPQAVIFQSRAVDNWFISRLGFINYFKNNVPPQETILIVVSYFEMLSSEGCALVSFRYIKLFTAKTATRINKLAVVPILIFIPIYIDPTNFAKIGLRLISIRSIDCQENSRWIIDSYRKRSPRRYCHYQWFNCV